MKPTASIQLNDSTLDIRLEWFDYDGDDCFRHFQILVLESDSRQKFDFGGCAIFGLRKLSGFFSDATQKSAGLGFRYPDIRFCDFYREGSNYRLIIKFEGTNLHKEFAICQGSVFVNDDFLKSY